MAAATTTWHPRTALSKKSWLLTNGEVVSEPPLEETASGRKVRIAGTSTSMFAKDVNDLIYQGVKSIAAAKGERVWMALDQAQCDALVKQVWGNRLTPGHKATLHLLKQAANTRHYGHSAPSTTAWWRFRHPSLPIEAFLVADMAQTAHGSGNAQQTVRTLLVMPSTNSLDAEFVKMVTIATTDMSELRNGLGHDHRLRLSEMLRDNKPNWDGEFTLDTQYIVGERAATKALLDTIRAIDGFESLDVPDLRDPDHPTWLTLDLHDTNVTGEFEQSLADYLDGGNVIEEVKKHYDEMVRLLRSAGLVLEDKTEGNFATALAGGEPVEVAVKTPPNEAGHQPDHNHSVVLHLPTGTIVVNCALSGPTNKDEIAHKWEESLTMASLTGQEDELLAYARQYAATANERRTKRILRERREIQ